MGRRASDHAGPWEECGLVSITDHCHRCAHCWHRLSGMADLGIDGRTSCRRSTIVQEPQFHAGNDRFLSWLCRFLRQCADRSEEHTSELQSLMRIPYAVFCLKKKNNHEITYMNKLIHEFITTTEYSHTKCICN